MLPDIFLNVNPTFVQLHLRINPIMREDVCVSVRKKSVHWEVNLF